MGIFLAMSSLLEGESALTVCQIAWMMSSFLVESSSHFASLTSCMIRLFSINLSSNFFTLFSSLQFFASTSLILVFSHSFSVCNIFTSAFCCSQSCWRTTRELMLDFNGAIMSCIDWVRCISISSRAVV